MIATIRETEKRRDANLEKKIVIVNKVKTSSGRIFANLNRLVENNLDVTASKLQRMTLNKKGKECVPRRET